MKIRPLYDQYGPDAYYQVHADTYENPHFPQIEALLVRNLPRFDSDKGILDFAAGGGEVTRVLLSQGIQTIRGSDPYLYELYERNTGCICDRYTFSDVVKKGLPERYSTIISSFALHLCPPKDLFSLAWNLLDAASLLVVITPHKRPALETLPGIQLLWEDWELTEKEKKVRLKAYKLMDN